VKADVHFNSVRSDWYAANTLLPRLIVKAVQTKQPLRLVGFPVFWIPVCVHYGIKFDEPSAPPSYVPLFSDLSPTRIAKLAIHAKKRGASRPLLEAAAALDPVIADLVYIVDHKIAKSGPTYAEENGANLLNTWHSFGRPEILRLQERMCRHSTNNDIFMILPCSRHRPYNESRTHTRLMQQLHDIGQPMTGAERVVVTSLGVVPEPYWRESLVLSYDAGAVDLWRVFQLLRVFFTINRARLVIDCLTYKPYSDMLRLLRELGVISELIRPLKLRWRAFYVDLA
jgi:Domain of unknown function (DUF5591)